MTYIRIMLAAALLVSGCKFPERSTILNKQPGLAPSSNPTCLPVGSPACGATPSPTPTVIQGPPPALGAPALHFSDIISGPKTGLGDGLGSGAIVTVWGSGLGSSQGSSKIYVGGVEASHVYYWGNADTSGASGPARLYNSYQQMQTISFSVPEGAANGPAPIYVVVNGNQSNILPFTIRAGNIWYVKTTGVDANGRGSWSSPFRTMAYVSKASSAGGPNPGPVAGDMIYVIDDVTDTNVYVRYMDGTAEAPISLIAYPGAHATILLPEGYGWGPHNHASVYWNISKITLKANGAGINTFRGMRAVGVEITNYPGGCATGQSGAISNDDLGVNIADTIGGGIKVFGAYIHDFGCNTTNKLHHVFYISNRGGVIQDSYELGWNYLTDNKAYGALHIYDENRCGDFSGTMKIHDNVVVNQTSVGFGVGSGGSTNTCFSMEVQAYNNLFVNIGLVNPGATTPHPQAIGINGWNNRATIKIYNNTFYAFSDPAAGGEPSFFSDMNAGSGGNFAGSWEFINNIIVNTRSVPYIGQSISFVPPHVTSNNLWFDVNGQIARPSWDSGALTSDPLFSDPANGLFTLKMGSPASGAGVDTSSVVVRDLLGIPRGLGGKAFSIGAFE